MSGRFDEVIKKFESEMGEKLKKLGLEYEIHGYTDDLYITVYLPDKNISFLISVEHVYRGDERPVPDIYIGDEFEGNFWGFFVSEVTPQDIRKLMTGVTSVLEWLVENVKP